MKTRATLYDSDESDALRLRSSENRSELLRRQTFRRSWKRAKPVSGRGISDRPSPLAQAVFLGPQIWRRINRARGRDRGQIIMAHPTDEEF